MSGYILGLRELVGHRPLLQVGASIIIEDAKGRILLEKRTDNLCWGYPGGSVELDERVEDAARRELREETGLIAGHMELFGVFSGRETHYIYPNGDEVSNVDIVFLCKDVTGTVVLQEDEISELRYFAWDELPQEISPPIRVAIDAWVAEKRKAVT